jgi:hypothetical protein
MPTLQLPQKSASVRARQVQRSVADVAELRDVQVHSERHCDLMVRITGYSRVCGHGSPRPGRDRSAGRDDRAMSHLERQKTR